MTTDDAIPPRLSPDEMPPFTDQASGDLAGARAPVSICDRWPVHLANDVEVRVAAPDDLAAVG